MKIHHIRHLIAASLACASLLHAETETTPIPFSEIGAKATADYQGDAIGITTTSDGARLHTGFQKLAGSVTSKGLTLVSTEKDSGSLKLTATSIGRDSTDVSSRAIFLPSLGKVLVEEKHVRWSRPGLVEEYSVSADGVRQDFIIAAAPAGTGDLSVELALTGARAEAQGDGARLTLDTSGRELAYSRLRVEDATGRILVARFEVLAANLLAVRVDDAGAVYPVRIDPTFSDADWISLSSGLPGADGSVYALMADGSGNIYFGGDFTAIGTIAANRIAKWDGSTWTALGSGMDQRVASLAVFGGNLYAGGDFTTAGGNVAVGIAKWNGSSWSALGTGLGDGGEGLQLGVNALAADAGNLFVGGQFATVGGIASRGVARWNGNTWSGLDSGVGGFIQALLIVGGDVYVGGGFETAGAGGLTVNGIARWNGSAWSALGSGLGLSGAPFATVYSLASYGGMIHVGGEFTEAGGVSTANIARWNGVSWSALGAGTDDTVHALTNFGGNLIVAGRFTTAGGTPARHIAKWNGTTWSGVGGGADTAATGIFSLVASGGDLFAGGVFSSVNSVPAKYAARWDGIAWSALGSGIDGLVSELAVSGGNLYLAGNFTTVGGIAANRIAKWDGSNWSALGSGLSGGTGGANVLLTDGPNLYAGGRFTTAGGVTVNRIGKWDGSSWSALGTGVSGGALPDVRALAIVGGELHAGGSFSSAGGVSAVNIAKWNGSAWSALGVGVGSSGVNAMIASGSDLYVAGSFTSAGGAPASRIAKWNGSAWSALGSGLGGSPPNALAFVGTDLFVGGQFDTAGGNPVAYIAKWDGSAWSALGSGLGGIVNALAANGTDLYVGGNFTSAGGAPVNHVAKWDGSAWWPLGSGTDSLVRSLAVNGSGKLFVGGDFRSAGVTVSNFIAQANIGPAPLGVMEQRAYVKASNTDANDGFGGAYDSGGVNTLPLTGAALAISGDTMVIGAPNEDSNSNAVNGSQSSDSLSNSGAAYVFVRGNDGSWSQQAYLKPSDPASEEKFGWSVAISGDTIAIGAPWGRGRAYVFQRSGTTWNEQASLSYGGLFGYAVAVEDNLLMVGAPIDFNGTSERGAVLVYNRTGTNWVQTQKLVSPTSDTDDNFGFSIDFAGNLAVVGVPGEDSNSVQINQDGLDNSATNSGAANVFRRISGTWTHEAYLKPFNTTSEDYFGWSVGVFGESVVVGAPYEDGSSAGVDMPSNDNLFDSGAAYVFARSGGIWTQQSYLKAGNPNSTDVFGLSVAASGNGILIGALGEDSGATGVNSEPIGSVEDSGAAYVFFLQGNQWSQLAYLKASNRGTEDFFGFGVALSGTTAVVSAIGEDSGATGVGGNEGGNDAGQSGAAYVFHIGPLTNSAGGNPSLSDSIAAAGLTGNNALPNAIPFNDGVENLLKYAFNMNLAGPDAATMAAGGTAGLPAISQAGAGAAGVLRFEFVRRTGSGLAYMPKKSTTLGPAGWINLTAAPTVTPIGTDGLWERVIYEEPSDPAVVPVCFGRVEVAIP